MTKASMLIFIKNKCYSFTQEFPIALILASLQIACWYRLWARCVASLTLLPFLVSSYFRTSKALLALPRASLLEAARLENSDQATRQFSYQ